MSLDSWVRVRTSKGEFQLPKDHKPFMVLPSGGAFSCANCTAHSEKDGQHHCSSPGYQKLMGTSLLKDQSGKPLDDPSRACSDWFTPKR